MPTYPTGSRVDQKHQAAVAATLALADEAAARADYADALAWLATVEAVGDSLTSAYHAKQRAWRLMHLALLRARRSEHV